MSRLRVMTRLLEGSTVLALAALIAFNVAMMVAWSACRSFPRRPCCCGLDCWGLRPGLDRSVRHGPLASGPPAAPHLRPTP